jgi:ribosomal protein S18 acetylase RimI-like enzyme
MMIRAMQTTDVEQVLALWQAACVEAVGHPLDADSTVRVRHALHQYVDHAQCHAWVALSGPEAIGFITCAVLGHPVQQGYLGEIEELYVQRGADRQGIQSALVREAVRWLQQLAVRVIRAEVATDDSEAMAFWRAAGWDQDTVLFALYADVPGDPALQAIWDDFAR